MNTPHRNGRHGNGGSSPEREAVSLPEILRAARRQRAWILGTIGVCAVATALFVFLRPPIYRATTTLRVEEGGKAELPVLDALSELSRGAKVETEMQILRSRRVAEGVVDDLGLQARIRGAGDLPRDSLFQTLRVARDAEAATYRLQRGPDAFTVSGPGVARTAAYDTTLQAGPLTMRPRPPSGDDAADLKIEVVPFARAVSDLQEDLGVSRPEREASIIEVAYESTDPVLARDVVNSTTYHFLELRNDMQKRQASAAVRFLREQVQNVKGQLAGAESALEDFRQKNLLLQVEAQVGEDVKRLADLQAQRNEIQVERDALRPVVKSLKEPGTDRSWAKLASFPAFLKNEAATGIIERLADLEAERTRQLGFRTEQDETVRSIEATMRVLETRLATLLESHLATLDDQAASLDDALGRFSDQLQKVPAVEVQYAGLKRNTDVLGQLYTFLQTRLKEAEISEAVEVANVQVVDPAVAPIEPVKPRKLLITLLGLLLGSGLAVGVAMARESTDTRLRSRDELVQLTGLPVLAMIPRIPGRNGGQRAPAARIESRLVTHHNPRSPAAEAYRTLRTGLSFSALDRVDGMKTLVFTSPEPQDGKSTTAANAAIALAEQGHRTLLVECDLRRSVFHAVFSLPRTPGLVEALLGQAMLDQVAHRIKLPDYVRGTLDVVPAGDSPPNPAELLGSRGMKEFLAAASERYEHVLLDTPPLNVVTDAAVLGNLADGVILVTRQGGTHRGALRLACEELRRGRANTVGAVLNDLNEGRGDYGYDYRYRGYYALKAGRK